MKQHRNLKPHSQARYLLCSDLDRTLIPNGHQAESPRAREILHALVDNHAVCVVYVTGRDRALVEDAVEQFALPWPDAVIGDVGTRIWSTFDERWAAWSQWDEMIRMDFTDSIREQARALAGQIDDLAPQPGDRQTEYKLSYYCPTSRLEPIRTALTEAFSVHQLPAAVIASVDETENLGLIDVLPARATKQGAIEMVMAA